MVNIERIINEIESGLLAEHTAARITLDIIERGISREQFNELVNYFGLSGTKAAQLERNRTAYNYPLPYSLNSIIAIIKTDYRKELTKWQ